MFYTDTHLAQKCDFLSPKYKKIITDTFSTVNYQNLLHFLHKSVLDMNI